MIDKETIRKVMSEMGSRGGKKGGVSRMESLTPEQRSELAKKAGKKSAEVRAKKAGKKAAGKKVASKKNV